MLDFRPLSNCHSGHTNVPGSDDDADDGELIASLASTSTPVASSSGRRVPLVFQTGDVVWGPHGNFPSWPGKLVSAPQSQPSVDGEAGIHQ